MLTVRFTHSKSGSRTSRKRWLALLALAAIGCVTLLAIDRAYHHLLKREADLRLEQLANRLQLQISNAVNTHIEVVENLAAFMLAPPTLPNWIVFDRYASRVLADHPVIHGLAYVDPSRTIRHFYPLAGNEDAIGLDLTTRLAAPFVERAIVERRTTINHPTVTVQGPLAVVVRTPLYRDDQFLGLVQGVIDINEALSFVTSGIDDDVELALSDARGRFFLGQRARHNLQVVVGSNFHGR